MAVEISNYSVCSESQWLEIWSQCRWSTWFESPRWAKIWHQTYGQRYSPAALYITFSDGLSCVLPAVEVTRLRGMVKVAELNPGGTFGGPVSTTDLKAEHIRCIINFSAKLWGNFSYRINPYLLNIISDDKIFNLLSSNILIKNDHTQSIHLGGSYDTIDKHLRASQVRRDALSARKKGFRIDQISDAELSDYLEAYRQSRSRWHKTNILYPPDFFSRLKDSPGCTFWGVRTKDGSVIGAGPILEGKKIATSWLALMKTDTLKYRPFELFYYELIHIYKERDFQWLDMNPSGGNPGVVKFKTKFSTEMISSPVIQKQTSLFRLLDIISNY
jgi:hypothetical protein